MVVKGEYTFPDQVASHTIYILTTTPIVHIIYRHYGVPDRAPSRSGARIHTER